MSAQQSRLMSKGRVWHILTISLVAVMAITLATFLIGNESQHISEHKIVSQWQDEVYHSQKLSMLSLTLNIATPQLTPAIQSTPTPGPAQIRAYSPHGPLISKFWLIIILVAIVVVILVMIARAKIV